MDALWEVGGGEGHLIPLCLGPMSPRRLGPVRPVEPPLTGTVGLKAAVLLPLSGHPSTVEAAVRSALVCAHPRTQQGGQCRSF